MLADGIRTADLMGPEFFKDAATTEMGEHIRKALDASL